MQRFCSLLVLGTALCVRKASATVELPDLAYGYCDLEPYISCETLEYHHGKHHAGYVTNVNAYIEEDATLENMTVDEIMMVTTGTVFNNAAQVYNHNFYWNSLSPTSGGEPTGAIQYAIIAEYGSFEYFKEVFSGYASGHFGSGWTWLVLTDDGSVTVVDTHDASNPLVEGLGTPLLTCDVWEHAYYIDYRNARSDYIESWWNLINWDYANQNLEDSSYSYSYSYSMELEYFDYYN